MIRKWEQDKYEEAQQTRAMMTYRWLTCFWLWLSESGPICAKRLFLTLLNPLSLRRIAFSLSLEMNPYHCLSCGPDFLPQYTFVFITHHTWQARGMVQAIPELFPSVFRHKQASSHLHAYSTFRRVPGGLKILLWLMPGSVIATVAISSKESRDCCVRTSPWVFCLPTALWQDSKASWKPFLSNDLKPATQTPQLQSWKQVCSPRISGYSSFFF